MNDIILTLSPALFGLLGTLAGGLITFATAHSLKSKEWKHELRQKGIAKREELYSAFLQEAANLLLKAIDSPTTKAVEFVHLGSLRANIRMISSPEVITAADNLFSYVINSRKKDEKEKQPKDSGMGTFSSVCREELDRLRKG